MTILDILAVAKEISFRDYRFTAEPCDPEYCLLEVSTPRGYHERRILPYRNGYVMSDQVVILQNYRRMIDRIILVEVEADWKPNLAIATDGEPELNS